MGVHANALVSVQELFSKMGVGVYPDVGVSPDVGVFPYFKVIKQNKNKTESTVFATTDLRP